MLCHALQYGYEYFSRKDKTQKMRNEYNDSGDAWLRTNDPLYGNRKNAGYLTKSMSDEKDRSELPRGYEIKSATPKSRDHSQWHSLGDGNYKRKAYRNSEEI